MLSEKSFPKKVYWKKLPEKSLKVYQKKYKSSKVFIVRGDPKFYLKKLIHSTYQMSSSSVSDNAMDVLERRLNTIERKIYGQESKKGAIPITAAAGPSATPCVTKLTEVAKVCGNALNNRERIAPLLRKLNDLETYLVTYWNIIFSLMVKWFILGPLIFTILNIKRRPAITKFVSYDMGSCPFELVIVCLR